MFQTCFFFLVSTPNIQNCKEIIESRFFLLIENIITVGKCIKFYSWKAKLIFHREMWEQLPISVFWPWRCSAFYMQLCTFFYIILHFQLCLFVAKSKFEKKLSLSKFEKKLSLSKKLLIVDPYRLATICCLNIWIINWF